MVIWRTNQHDQKPSSIQKKKQASQPVRFSKSTSSIQQVNQFDFLSGEAVCSSLLVRQYNVKHLQRKGAGGSPGKVVESTSALPHCCGCD
jgi:hypothetical protein